MNITRLTGEDRRIVLIAKLTIAINATIAQQVNDGRGHRPWLYNDTKRMLSVADLLDLDEVSEEQEIGEHYALVSQVQAPEDKVLDNVVKVLSSPHAVFKPKVYPDGNQWCALYGDDLMMGVCGFGDTPAEACADFDKNWKTQTLLASAGSAND